MTFEYWLKKYIKNDKAVCDLLTDYYFVCRMEKAKGRKNQSSPLIILKSLAHVMTLLLLTIGLAICTPMISLPPVARGLKQRLCRVAARCHSIRIYYGCSQRLY